MKNRILAVALALCLCFAPCTAFAGGAQLLPSITVNLPETPGLTCTLTDVLSYHHPYDGKHMKFYLTERGTISFNQDVQLLVGWHTQYGRHEFANLRPGETYTVSSATGRKDDGYSGHVFLGGIGFSASQIYYFKGKRMVDSSYIDTYLASSEEDLRVKYGMSPITDIAVGGGQAPAPVPASGTAYVPARPSAQSLLADGRLVDQAAAYNISGNNYFKLRDLAQIMNGSLKQFEVSWDASQNAISLVSGAPYTSVGGELAAGTKADAAAIPATTALFLNGNLLNFTAYSINGNNYFKLRDIAEAFDFYVGYDGGTKTVILDSGKRYQ